MFLVVLHCPDGLVLMVLQMPYGRLIGCVSFKPSAVGSCAIILFLDALSIFGREKAANPMKDGSLVSYLNLTPQLNQRTGAHFTMLPAATD